MLKEAERLQFVADHATDDKLAACIARHQGKKPQDMAEAIFREFLFPVSKAMQDLLNVLAVE